MPDTRDKSLLIELPGVNNLAKYMRITVNIKAGRFKLYTGEVNKTETDAKGVVIGYSKGLSITAKQFNAAIEITKDIPILLDYVEKALAADLKDGGKRYKGADINSFQKNITAAFQTWEKKNTGKVVYKPITNNSLYAAILDDARETRTATEKQKRAADARADRLQTVKEASPAGSIARHKRDKDTALTTSKFSNTYFSPAPDLQQINGQLSMSLPMGTNENDACLLASFTVDHAALDAAGIDNHELDIGFDYFVMSLCDQMYKEGITEFTLTQMSKRLGIAPNSQNLNAIFQSLIKGSKTSATVNNKEVLDAWNIDTENYQEISGAVIPVAWRKEFKRVNGCLSSLTIKLLDYSPFYQVAEPLGHLQPWNNEVFTLYSGKKNRRYWLVLRYLLQQIAWMNNGNGKTKRSNTITWAGLCGYCGDISYKKQHATMETARKILTEVLAPLQYIRSFEETDTGLTIILDTKHLQQDTKKRLTANIK